MDSTATSPERELATQQLYARQLLMRNHLTWPPCTHRCENVRTCQQHSASPVTNIPILGSVTPYLTDSNQRCKWKQWYSRTNQKDTNTHQVDIMSDYMKVMRERSDSSKRTEDSDHKEVLTFTLRSNEEHIRAVNKHAVNNMASSFEPNAQRYVLSNLFTRLHAKVDLNNSLLESISAGEEKQERFAELGHQLEVQIEMVSELP